MVRLLIEMNGKANIKIKSNINGQNENFKA